MSRLHVLFAYPLVVALLVVPWGIAQEKSTLHPLDPLSAFEIESAVALLGTKHGSPRHLVAPFLALDEPTKAELQQHKLGKKLPRRVFAVLLDHQTNTTYETIVDLSNEKILQWKNLENLKAQATGLEVDTAESVVRAHKPWQDAMKQRGITDLTEVDLSTWIARESLSGKLDASRLFHVIAYLKEEAETNTLGKPIEGVVASVDVVQGKVVRLLNAQKTPTPTENADFFDAKMRGPNRKAPKPLTIRQPEGASFTLEGQLARWQKWQFRYALHPREGLVLYQVGYEDGDGLRPILHRASLSEMVVPYADPDPTWSWRTVFDQGDLGIGTVAGPLVRGRDVPENALLLDAVLADEYGVPQSYGDVIALFERDGGMLLKHLDDRSFTRSVTRRSRELVLRYIATVGNYDYALSWIFRQDGSIHVRVEMTGVMLAKAIASEQCALCKKIEGVGKALEQSTTVEPTGDQRFGTLVGKRVVAVNHQHLFNFRLDFAVDGERNSFSELNVRPLVGKENPLGNAFVQTETLFAKEQEVRRNVSLEQRRCWKVFNPNKRSRLGHHPAYLLMPGENGVSYLGQANRVRQRAEFMNHHVWATRHHSRERHAAGEYPRQNPNREGLSKWSGDESIVDRDLVVWYTLVATHIPRPEEWPVMPTESVGFRLLPSGFFRRNPALDVPE